MKKACYVFLMDSTEKFSMIGRYKDTGKYVFNSMSDIPRGIMQRIIITSHDEIKNNDYYFDCQKKVIHQAFNLDEDRLKRINNIVYLKKIISLNNSSLPQVSDNLIKTLIEDNNYYYPIVMVEYEDMKIGDVDVKITPVPVINEDNTINGELFFRKNDPKYNDKLKYIFDYIFDKVAYETFNNLGGGIIINENN
jgi:hypothetical protein